ncbi:Hypothetical protein Ccan_12860 [Capnocytophaga canimorsus Cc5]|uniref:Uncharacterized protein n=1 Tax=Capnocytophaga canimorsus (strain 5) TaxID=860228 RepID=F9YPQ6_CAPCC|nr:Hypothetical protein Ccan_12860 [Capnocytophaga canimorsus Cc5]CEN45918.1 conserved hypothetical protein [Capnocytophaga canimorsus]
METFFVFSEHKYLKYNYLTFIFWQFPKKINLGNQDKKTPRKA